MKFENLNLPGSLEKSLADMNFTKPTPIQEKTIPLAMRPNQDILGTAQTGTGKTGAFAIPMVAKILSDSSCDVMVLTPTRELATQVIDVFRNLLRNDRKIKTALLIGGASIHRQVSNLRAKPRVIVGTPGRVYDHIERGTLKIKHLKSIILDETDLMLDMGFDIQIDKIIKTIPSLSQTLLFSATLSKKIEKVAEKYLYKPERVSIGKVSKPGENIDQDVVFSEMNKKFDILNEELSNRKGSKIIFVNTKRWADTLCDRLKNNGFKSAAIHGDLRQSRRERVMKEFRSERYKILVATDVASRGIDIPHIKHVINYDLPQCAEDYVHRIGRTARAGKEGKAISFLTKEDGEKWDAITQLLDAKTQNKLSDQVKTFEFLPAKKVKKPFRRRRKDFPRRGRNI